MAKLRVLNYEFLKIGIRILDSPRHRMSNDLNPNNLNSELRYVEDSSSINQKSASKKTDLGKHLVHSRIVGDRGTF